MVFAFMQHWRSSNWKCAVALALITLAVPGKLRALDKQGSAHAGQVAGPDHGVEIAGSLLVGAGLYNPSYAARPDNSGLALLRMAGHADLDLIGHRLSIPVDLNVFSDRRRRGGAKLLPSELDVITGVTSTWAAFRGSAVEFGARYERDMPVDRPGLVQQYVDARCRLLLDAAQLHEKAHAALHGVGLSGAATLGVFAYNPTYAARPDNSGLALLRYALNVRTLLWERLGLSVDATCFSDRHAHSPMRPSELDLTLSTSVQLSPFEVSLAFERDMPLDHGHYAQQMLFVYATWSFTAFSTQEQAASAR